MKKLIVLLSFAVILTGFTGCFKDDSANDASNNTQSQASSTASREEISSKEVQLVNPFKSCETLDDAISVAGFEMTAPDSVKEGFDERIFRAMKDSMIEIIYKNEADTITVRKGAGTDDVSGDFNKYEAISEVSVGEINAVLKLNGDAVMVVTWTAAENAFSISSASGISKEEAIAIIKAVS